MIAGRLGTLVGACSDPHETLARLRGAQSALFLAGWLAAFDTGALFAAHATAHGSALDDAAIGLLRGYTSTQRAALGVIALASRAPAETIARSTVVDVDRRTGGIRIGNRQHALPSAAAGIARAHRLARTQRRHHRPTAVHRPPRPRPAAEARRRSTPAARTRRETGLTFTSDEADRYDEIAVHDLDPPAMALLNRRLIATRRAALGLSRHDLAQASGVATDAIEHIETSGSHDNLPFAAAIQLAAALGIPIADLLQPTAPRPTVGRGDIAVEALLAEQRRTLSAEDIARILDWTLRRTLAALRALERRLDGTGQALQRLPVNRYALVSAATALTTAQRRDAGRRQLQRLDVATAEVLHRVVCGPRQDRRWNAYSDDERPHLAQFISLGLVHDTGGQLQLSAELMANLGLTTTDKQMTTTSDISMTKPLPSR